jgi:hypothetical protein|tara:strand:- start:569 stop:1210 length:642 start_codon:yes stop_codon:yes gene_type:complete
LNKLQKILILIGIFFLNPISAEDINENVKKIINEESADILVKNLNQHFITNFPSERQLCEKNLITIINNRSLSFLKESEKIQSIDNKKSLKMHANKMKSMAPVFARAGCLVKYRFELEKILYGSFHESEETILFQKASQLNLNEPKKLLIIHALSKDHNTWIKDNLDLEDKSERERRNNGFNEVLNSIAGFYINNSSLGCKKKSANSEVFLCN